MKAFRVPAGLGTTTCFPHLFLARRWAPSSSSAAGCRSHGLVFTVLYLLPSLGLGMVGLGRYLNECFPPFVAAGMLLDRVAGVGNISTAAGRGVPLGISRSCSSRLAPRPVVAGADGSGRLFCAAIAVPLPPLPPPLPVIYSHQPSAFRSTTMACVVNGCLVHLEAS